MTKRQLLCLVLAVLMFVAVTGCTTTSPAASSGTQAPASSAPSSPASTSTAPSPTGTVLPISSTKITLNYFIELDTARVGVTHTNYGDLPCFKDLEKLTNIHVNFLHPPTGQAQQQLNLMISSNDMPDMAYYKWATYPGGPDKLINDGVILKLNDPLKQYGPNLTAIYNKDPQLRKDSMTDAGNYYYFPCIQKDPLLTCNFGYVVRKDWLDKVGMKPPVTIDDWHNVLTAFKTKDPNGNGQQDEIPLVSRYNDASGNSNSIPVQNFYNAWGSHWDFYTKDGKAYYGPYEPQYKDLLKTMAQWYKEGLIDPDFATINQEQHDAKVVSSKAGAFRVGLGDMGTYLKALGGDENIFVGVANPVLKAGDKVINLHGVSRPISTSGAVVNPKSKYVKEAVQWLDYGYGYDGYMLLNYGREGEQYNMVNGFPTLVDSIMHDPKMSINVALSQFCMGAEGYSFWNDPAVREQRQFTLGLQKNCSATWSTEDVSGLWPATTPSANESNELSGIMSEVKTYMNERTLAFIMGKANVDTDFDKYIQTMKSMGMDRALEIQNAALKRYLAR